MATRNRTILYRKYRDVLKSVRVPSSSSPTSSSGGPVIELSMASLLNPNRSYAPLSTEDPGSSRYIYLSMHRYIHIVISAFSVFFLLDAVPLRNWLSFFCIGVFAT